MTKIKICGLSRKEDIYTVNDLLPELIGFVFAPSKRQVSFTQAQELHKLLAQQIKTVGVFVEPSSTEVLALYSANIIQIAQLHGQIDATQIQYLQQKGLPVIHAVHNRKMAIDSPAAYIMFDSATPGSGKHADWDHIPDLHRPFVLAGGLTPQNVNQAISQLHPQIVDVSSGVEVAGKKDFQKINSFIRSVRDAK
ncbi:phosphoribosylanthranilate isomerase [Liquorilactobacillus capillatus]|uniref:N-(5'-phosphoribosyl)anthranilate isomerase n=1 Tax=Liquorilactobacillus capillatus DSM 19910 TaxID=1423731 RepID=A0A0R1M291_9LACO|nr:phosphoribosylanthranilate isomerase [Liquorilactobacillus capillatus]KRL01825.1 N-(5-phosphoribosyl)anthranilate isomerase (PRAI) [Liquorilactobacillus capillatus DSM 19910]